MSPDSYASWSDDAGIVSPAVRFTIVRSASERLAETFSLKAIDTDCGAAGATGGDEAPPSYAKSPESTVGGVVSTTGVMVILNACGALVSMPPLVVPPS